MDTFQRKRKPDAVNDCATPGKSDQEKRQGMDHDVLRPWVHFFQTSVHYSKEQRHKRLVDKESGTPVSSNSSQWKKKRLLHETNRPSE